MPGAGPGGGKQDGRSTGYDTCRQGSGPLRLNKLSGTIKTLANLVTRSHGQVWGSKLALRHALRALAGHVSRYKGGLQGSKVAMKVLVSQRGKVV